MDWADLLGFSIQPTSGCIGQVLRTCGPVPGLNVKLVFYKGRSGLLLTILYLGSVQPFKGPLQYNY